MSSFSLENLQSLDPVEFENLVKALFQKMGFKATTTRISGDGGIDIFAINELPIVGGKYVIQCKRYAQGNNIGEPAVRDLYGSMMHENANKGILITTSDFSKKAINFSQNKAIELINGNSTLNLLNQHLVAADASKTFYSIELMKRDEIIGFVEKRIAEAKDSCHTHQIGEAHYHQSSCPRLVISDLEVFDSESDLIWMRDANIAGKRIGNALINEVISVLNRAQYAHSSEWRLPSAHELKTLIMLARNHDSDKQIGKLLMEIGFQNVQSGFYWTSTETLNDSPNIDDARDSVWSCDIFMGRLGAPFKSNSLYLLPVRSSLKSNQR